MKIAFLGTPDFAVPSLEALIRHGDEIVVFSQPDRPVGRHAVLMPTAVKAAALAHGLPVFQFDKIRSPEGLQALRDACPDLMVTAAFGQLLSAENLAVPRYGCINVHGSLLPRYRGAAPIQWAVINGDRVTGVTTMMTDIGMDTGDILLKRETEILPDETAGELFTRLSQIGADLLIETIDSLLAGTLVRTPQDPSAATKCSMLKKEDGRIDFTASRQAVHDRVRGVCPWPGAFATLDNGDVIKIWKTSLSIPADTGRAMEPGTCLMDKEGHLCVRCRDGFICILELQAPGAKRMDATAFLRGHDISGRRFV